MRLRIASLAVELSIEEPGLRQLAGRRYAEFRAEIAPDLRLRVVPHPGLPGPEPVRAAVERGLIALDGPGAAAQVDLGRGEGEIRAGDLFPLDLALRCAIVARALEDGGVALHAGAVVAGGAAHVFPAPSGRGKSTLAAWFGELLADEMVVLLPGPRDAVVAHGTPWNRGRPASAPVGALHRLAWGSVALEPLPAGAGALLCARNLALYAAGAELERRAFQNALGLGARIPAHRLSFTRNAAPALVAA